jgi:type II secretory pathway pseudopilin PulG
MPSNIPVNANAHGPVNANSHSQGNPLVELVVVVTMLGVFSSFAIPRFTRLENHARASEVAALSVNLRGVAAAAHAQYLAGHAQSLESGARLSSATLKGRTLRLEHGYPDANGIRVAIPDPSGFTVNSTPTSVTYSKADAPAPALCAVTYHPSPTASSEATITELKTSGC